MPDWQASYVEAAAAGRGGRRSLNSSTFRFKTWLPFVFTGMTELPHCDKQNVSFASKVVASLATDAFSHLAADTIVEFTNLSLPQIEQ